MSENIEVHYHGCHEEEGEDVHSFAFRDEAFRTTDDIHTYRVLMTTMEASLLYWIEFSDGPELMIEKVDRLPILTDFASQTLVGSMSISAYIELDAESRDSSVELGISFSDAQDATALRIRIGRIAVARFDDDGRLRTIH